MADKFLDKVIVLSTILAGIAVGGLFLDGTTLENPILQYFPTWVHTFFGWVIIVTGGFAGLRLFGIKI